MNVSFKSANRCLNSSLERFFKYHVKSEIISEPLPQIIFVDENHLVDVEYIDSSPELFSANIIPMSYMSGNQKDVLDLMSIGTLQENIISAVYHQSTHRLLSSEIVKKKFHNFFSGHHNDELFTVLKHAKNYLRDGLDTEHTYGATLEEVIRICIKPAIEEWQLFLNRYLKYRKFLILCGFESEIQEIDSILENVSEHMKLPDNGDMKRLYNNKDVLLSSFEQLVVILNDIRSYDYE